jgi:ABC-type multidrug transport system ATPase subunit
MTTLHGDLMPARRTQPIATWLLGSLASCEIVLNEATVSARHCRLNQFPDGHFELEDLGSTNGTYVNGQPLIAHNPVDVSPEQRITLGPNATFPWPARFSPEAAAAPHPSADTAPGARIIRIGRAQECDVILDYGVVSREHARIIESAGHYAIEDLHSTNGTALNQLHNRISTRITIHPEDELYFGSFKIKVSRLLSERGAIVGEAVCESIGFQGSSIMLGRDPQCDQPLSSPLISWHHAQITRSPQGIFVEDLGSLNGTFVNGERIQGKVQVAPGQEISLASFRFQVRADGRLERRENHGNVSIEAAQITVNAPDGTRLLDPISLTVYPSELVALMGPAGSGKTTLLKALNGYTPPASGNVLFNGANLYRYYDLFRQQMGYVPQDDIVHPELTVREALYFSAKLRTDLSDAEIAKRIDSLLEELGIRDKKNSRIGSPERKVLSGGQRKRVNIAMELITDTPVLFLDEPTSGLSSYDAEGVIELLKRLAHDGKTIITTIHQPSINIFRKFDDLIMISRDSGGPGAMAYFGPAYPDSIQFFRPRPRGRYRCRRRPRPQPRNASHRTQQRPHARIVRPFRQIRIPQTVHCGPRRKNSRRRSASPALHHPPLQHQAMGPTRAPQPDPKIPRPRAARPPRVAGPALRIADRPDFWSATRAAKLERTRRSPNHDGRKSLRRARRQHRRNRILNGRRRHMVRLQQRRPRHRRRMDHLPARAHGKSQTPVLRVFEICGFMRSLRFSMLSASGDRHNLLRSEGELLRNAGGPYSVFVGRRRAGPGNFRPQQHHRKRHPPTADRPTANPRARRRSPRRLQNARARPLDQHPGPLTLGL